MARVSASNTVAASGCTLDTVFADELLERGPNGCRPGRGALADLALRERLFGLGDYLDDALLGGLGLRRGLVRHRPLQAKGRSLAVISELDLDIVEAGSGRSYTTRGDTT